jgi:hypothetical protein
VKTTTSRLPSLSSLLGISSQLILCCVHATAGSTSGESLIEPEVPERFLIDLTPSLEALIWSGDSPPSALMESDDSILFAPRFRLDADASLDDQFFMRAAVCVDRGFDPNTRESGDLRLDEFLLRWQPLDDKRINFQMGRFATAFGAWQSTHDFFSDPFLLAPLPYSQIIGVQTRNPGAMTPAAIAARADGTAPPVSTLSKDKWASVIWGPSYSNGASIFGSSAHFDYVAEIKNSALSSHPDSWESLDFSDPAFTTRVGYRPDAAWAFGVSASQGPWMEEQVPGIERGDFQQSALGIDARWAQRHLIFTGEWILSEFETPAVGDLRTTSWFVGARWKASARMFLASRFGQMLANDARPPGSNAIPWQADVWRAEFAAGWRLAEDCLLKATYSYTHTDGDSQAGEHNLGAGIGWRF